MATTVEGLGPRHNRDDPALCIDGATDSATQPSAVLSWTYSDIVSTENAAVMNAP